MRAVRRREARGVERDGATGTEPVAQEPEQRSAPEELLAGRAHRGSKEDAAVCLSGRLRPGRPPGEGGEHGDAETCSGQRLHEWRPIDRRYREKRSTPSSP